MTHTDFELASGSVVGRDHRLVPRNCQDSFIIRRSSRCTIGIVTDGSGSGPHSEIGAVLGARFLAHQLQGLVDQQAQVGDQWQSELWYARRVLASSLYDLGRNMGNMFRDSKSIVRDYLLFTIVGFVLDEREATFFTIGDGVVIVNGEITTIGPFPGNAPPYVGYHLIGESVDIDLKECEFTIVKRIALEDLDTFLIGCDGVTDLINAAERPLPGLETPTGHIDQYWMKDRYYSNPDMVRRQLWLTGRDWPKKDPSPGLLPDDTTLIAGRRKEV